ncbi:hypothetical protein [Microbacterium indicum]|uniref:hypothetical protein n=1 Tax=Microbacterium indicum TaxID=358100 RepID=UPI0003F6FA34|nr:hypothetical protein [Microbacterium indicum]
MTRDDAFLARVIAAADDAVDALAGAEPIERAPLGPHRESMRRAKLLVAAYLAPAGRFSGEASLIEQAGEYARALTTLQTPSGLFSGGDNVESPPDSGFTLNDVGDILALIEASMDPALETLGAGLAGIARTAIPAMLTGGVHTPNHRWELAAALARLLRVAPDTAAVRSRIDQWLAEGIDIDADGQFSERSANYAAHVSLPALFAMAGELARPDLLEIAHRNLLSLVGAIHDDATVETVHSRRQDQCEPSFALAPLLVPLRRAALATGDETLAWAASVAARADIAEPQTVLADILLHPEIAEELPEASVRPVGRFSWPESGLVIDRNLTRAVTVFGGSDYAKHRRIRSGLANNPTFLRIHAGEVVIESVRLSREFFGLGPFRADEMAEGDGGIDLGESVTGSYYQPLAPEHRRSHGVYPVVDEGRFSAAMAFGERARTDVELTTRIRVIPTLDGVDLDLSIDGPQTAWSLEIAFRPGGVLDGSIYRAGDDAVRVETSASVGTGFYRPGEDYTYLGGTDAMPGPRLYVTGRAPGSAHVRIRRL